MTTEELNQQLALLPDLKLVEKELSKLYETRDKNFKMIMPVQLNDSDILFSELIKRYNESIKNEKLENISTNPFNLIVLNIKN